MHLGIVKITYNRTTMHFMDDRFVNLVEEVILTLLWQTGASESATVCLVISLSICNWLFKCGVLRVVFVLVCVLACVREREREVTAQRHVCLCVCVCVCVCIRVYERGRQGHTTVVLLLSLTRLCSPLGLELMVKLKTLLTVFTLILIMDSRLWKGALHF